MALADELEIKMQKMGDIGIVTADGIVDLATMRPMREAVRGLLSDGVKHVVLDLRNVGYMDSAGISIIMTAKRGVSDQSGAVYLVTKPGAVQRSLEMIQMDRVVQIVDSPERALSDLSVIGEVSTYGDGTVASF